MAPDEADYLAPDPETEPEKCSGIRISFTIVSVLGIALLVCAVLLLYVPDISSFLRSVAETFLGPNGAESPPLQHGGGPPVFR